MSKKAKPTITLAQLYEKQNQLLDALVIYQQLLNKEYSDDLDEKIKELKDKIFNDGALEYSPAIDKIFTTEDKKNFKILPHDEYKAFIESQAQHTNEETYPEEMLQEKAEKTDITEPPVDDIPESEQKFEEEPITEDVSEETEDIVSEPELQEKDTESFSEIQEESETISMNDEMAPISNESKMEISDEPGTEMDIGMETSEEKQTVEGQDLEIPEEKQTSNEDQLDEIQESESEIDIPATDEKEQTEDTTVSEDNELSPEIEPIEEPVKEEKKEKIEEAIEPEVEKLQDEKTTDVESEIEPIQPVADIEEKLHAPEGADVLDLLKDLKNIDVESLNNILIENLGEDRTLDEVKLSDVHYALELLRNTDETEE